MFNKRSSPYVFFALMVGAAACIPPTFGFVPNILRYGAHYGHVAQHDSTSALSMSIPTVIDTATSGVASICRLPGGVTVSSGSRAKKYDGALPTLECLYDIENDRECRIVRELITELDLIVEKVIPAAGPNALVFRNNELPANTEIPRLVVTEPDGSEKVFSGAEDITYYLKKSFSVPDREDEDDIKVKVIDALRQAGNYVASVLRIGRGTAVSPAAMEAAGAPPRPEQPLILYSYEGNQFCRLVREVLTELDLVYELRSAGKESPRRSEMATITPDGSTQCPFLIDPNTDTKMFESADIVSYLYKTYAAYTPPSELLQWTSQKLMVPALKPVFAKLAPLQAGANSDDSSAYDQAVAKAKSEIESEASSHSVLVYTYSLSPFSSETLALLDSLEIKYKEISLGKEWLPGLINEGGSEKRAALLEMTGQSSLPHIFVGGKSIGGLFSGEPGLLPALEQGTFKSIVEAATSEVMPDIVIKTPAVESVEPNEGAFE